MLIRHRRRSGVSIVDFGEINAGWYFLKPKPFGFILVQRRIQGPVKNL